MIRPFPSLLRKRHRTIASTVPGQRSTRTGETQNGGGGALTEPARMARDRSGKKAANIQVGETRRPLPQFHEDISAGTPGYPSRAGGCTNSQNHTTYETHIPLARAKAVGVSRRTRSPPWFDGSGRAIHSQSVAAQARTNLAQVTSQRMRAVRKAESVTDGRLATASRGSTLQARALTAK
jgi:hypothetical protein